MEKYLINQKRKKFGTRYHLLQTTQFEPNCTGRGSEYTIFGGSCRVTLVVAFSFCPKILGGGADPWMVLYFFILWMQVEWWDTWTTLAVIEFIWTFCTHRQRGRGHRSCTQESPCETFTFNLFFFSLTVSNTWSVPELYWTQEPL